MPVHTPSERAKRTGQPQRVVKKRAKRVKPVNRPIKRSIFDS